jgi:hypothetical protein
MIKEWDAAAVLISLESLCLYVCVCVNAHTCVNGRICVDKETYRHMCICLVDHIVWMLRHFHTNTKKCYVLSAAQWQSQCSVHRSFPRASTQLVVLQVWQRHYHQSWLHVSRTQFRSDCFDRNWLKKARPCECFLIVKGSFHNGIIKAAAIQSALALHH